MSSIGRDDTYPATTTTTTTGPYRSDMANRADPTIDSGRERRGNPVVGEAGPGGMGSTHTAGSTDPRVDSGTHGTADTTGLGIGSTGRRAGFGSTHGPTEQTTTGGSMGGAGLHQAPILNKLDPRVDSDRDHRASHATTHAGPAPNTAGPHRSDIANKLDPRVDSDLDGSRTVGGDKTYSTGTGAGTTGTTGGTHPGIVQ